MMDGHGPSPIMADGADVSPPPIAPDGADLGLPQPAEPPLKLSWLGRAVKIIDFTRDEGLAMQPVFTESREKGLRMLVVACLRYVDDGTPVFANIDAVGAIPNRLSAHLERLAVAAMRFNDPTRSDGDDPLS